MPETRSPRMHILHFHDCPGCGEGNAYYDRPEEMDCDHCGTRVPMTQASQPFEDAALDEEQDLRTAERAQEDVHD